MDENAKCGIRGADSPTGERNVTQLKQFLMPVSKWVNTNMNGLAIQRGEREASVTWRSSGGLSGSSGRVPVGLQQSDSVPVVAVESLALQPGSPSGL